jgi:hypothetical protein
MTLPRMAGLTILFLAGFTLSMARGEIPQQYWTDPQNAPEFFAIQVLNVRLRMVENNQWCTRYQVEAIARVQGILRSKAGLKPGAVIGIRYEVTYGPPAPGKRNTYPLLKSGGLYQASMQAAYGTPYWFEPYGYPDSPFVRISF